MEHRLAVFAMNGSIVERKQHFNVAANLAQIPSSRTQFTFSYVLLERGEQFIQKFNERPVVDRYQVGNTVHIHVLHHVTPRADGILQ